MKANLAAPAPTTDHARGGAPIDPAMCPRCGGKLTNPESLGWCSQCGYCRSVEEEAATKSAPVVDAEAPKHSALGATEFATTMRLMPSWSWPIIVGVGAIVIVCWAGNLALEEICLARAAWSAGQIVLCVLGLLAAQLWIICYVGDSEYSLGPRDMFGFRIWRAGVRRLPETQQPLWLGSWCLTGLLCGIFLIGGFNYWFKLFEEARLSRLLRNSAGKLEKEEADREKKLSRNEPNRDPEPPPEPTGPETRAMVPCVVLGYQTDATGNLTGLVVATTNGNSLQYGGVVSGGWKGPEAKAILTELSRIRRSEPLIAGLKVKGTVWVKPMIFCDIAHTGVEKNGELKEPKFSKVNP